MDAADKGKNVAEHINPELDALLRNDFDNEATLQIYADWLDAQNGGDPRGTLIRTQLESEAAEREAREHPTIQGSGFRVYWNTSPAKPEAEALVATHWARWFGDLPKLAVHLTWEQ